MLSITKYQIKLRNFKKFYSKKSSASMASSASSLVRGRGRRVRSTSALDNSGGKCKTKSSFSFSIHLVEQTKPKALIS